MAGPAEPSVSASASDVSRPDWSREAKSAIAWDPGRSLLAAVRAYQRVEGRSGPGRWLVRKIAVLRHRCWSVIAGADIPINTRIGGGLLIPHPNGIVVHPLVSIGSNCLIFHQVTLGMNRGQVPVIGAGVNIAAGAKIIGGVRIGDGATVGANAVVTRDVPAGATVAGIPARLLHQDNL